METMKTVHWIILFGVAIIAAGIVGLGFAFRRWPSLRKKMLMRLLECPDRATFLATRNALRASIGVRLQTADADTRLILQTKLSDLNDIFDNPDEELPKVRERVFNLKRMLKKQGKAINKARLFRATEALEMENYGATDAILETETRTVGADRSKYARRLNNLAALLKTRAIIMLPNHYTARLWRLMRTLLAKTAPCMQSIWPSLLNYCNHRAISQVPRRYCARL